MENYVVVGVLFFILVICIFVAIARWIFRINAIVQRLDEIIYALQGNPEKPKSFIDGLKKGME